MTLYSYDAAVVPSAAAGMPVPKDELKAFFWVAEDVGISLDQWLEESDNGPGQISPPTVIARSSVTLDGKEGVVRITESEGIQSISYYIPLSNARVFVVNAGPGD
jgi:hypothetical protein